jgi:small subunit ribosomal protein S15
MPLALETKRELIGTYRSHERDSGSPEVQVALLTERIRQLTEHLQAHRKDYAGRRGLLMMVGRRASLLKYLARTSPERYRNLVARLKLRR